MISKFLGDLRRLYLCGQLGWKGTLRFETQQMTRYAKEVSKWTHACSPAHHPRANSADMGDSIIDGEFG